MDIQNIDFGRILKWTLIVLITGFIAQFGKSFAQYVMTEIRSKRAPEKSKREAGGRVVPQSPPLPTDQDSAESESRKPGIVTPAAPPEDKTQEKLQKKALKAQVKQQKKMAEKP